MMPDMTQHGKAETEQWTPQQNVPVIMFDRVSKTYGRINALNSVSLGISGGVTGILGMNGAGKSTLFKLMMGKGKTKFWCNQIIRHRPLEKSSTIFTCWLCSRT